MALAGCLQPQPCTCTLPVRRRQTPVLSVGSARDSCSMQTSASGGAVSHHACSPQPQQQSAAGMPGRRIARRRMYLANAAPNRSVVEEAVKLTRDENRDQAYRSGAAYLRTMGIDSQTELTRVLDTAMNPNSLFAGHQNKLRVSNASARLLSVDEDIRPVIEYLHSLGLSDQQVKEVVLEHPPVISYSPAEQLAPFLEGLKELGVRDPLAVVVRRPSLLGLSLRDNVQRIVEYLKEAGNSMEQIEELLATTI